MTTTRRDCIHEAAHLVQQRCTNSLSSPTRALTEPLVPVVLALLQSERDVHEGNTPTIPPKAHKRAIDHLNSRRNSVY
jgi:hypothetical protein